MQTGALTTEQSTTVGVRYELDSLTALRFFAAALVVGRHYFRATANLPLLNNIGDVGTVGVGFFFLLSGFVLTWSFRPAPASNFYRRRFARVYPMHLLTWGLALAIAAYLAPGSPHLLDALPALVLVQSFIPSRTFYYAANPPSWSLSCEAFFYALSPMTIPRLLAQPPRVLVRVIAAAAVFLLVVAVPVVALLSQPQAEAATYVQPVYRFAEFLIGVAMTALLRQDALPAVRLPVAVTLTIANLLLAIVVNVAVVHVLHMGYDLIVADLIMLPGWCVLIASAATTDLRGEWTFGRWPWLVRLGRWSFVLYLIHVPVLAIVQHFVPAPYGHAQGMVVLLIAVGSAVIASALLHVFVETPIERRLRGSRRPRVD